MARKCKQEAKAQQAVLPLMGPDAAGIDIGATEIWGWPCRHFPTFTQDLYGYADWLKQVRSEDRADVLGKSHEFGGWGALCRRNHGLAPACT